MVPSHMFYASCGSLVGLCCLAEKVVSKGGPVFLSQAPICPCVGFGVLRGIDMARGLYFLLTPVDPSVLRDVNCLLFGAISMPSCVLTTQPGIDGEMPYITTDYSFDLTGAGKLRVFKGMTRPSQVGMQWHFCSILPFTFPHQSALAFECTELRLRWDTSYFCFKVHTLTLLEFCFLRALATSWNLKLYVCLMLWRRLGVFSHMDSKITQHIKVKAFVWWFFFFFRFL